MHALAGALALQSPDAVYHRLRTHWTEPEKIVCGATESAPYGSGIWLAPPLLESQARMMFTDLITYLPDDVLTKVDRASMGVSLEARVPILDHRVVEFAARVPLRMKIRNRRGKWILRQVLYKHVPQQMVERPKMGFGVPVGTWLRGPLRDWAEALLNEERLRREGYLRPDPIREVWAEHLTGRRNWEYQLWHVLMFQAWREVQA